MARVPRRSRRATRGTQRGARDHAQPAEALEGTAPRRADGPDDGLPQHDRARERARLPRRRGARAPVPRLDPLERRHHRAPRAAPRHRRRRPHLDLRVVAPRSTRSATTTSSAARTTPAAATRSSIQGHASPGMYARAFLEGRLSADQLDGFRQEKSHAPERPLVLPAPAAHARVLAVPDRVDGPRPDQRDLPGAGQPLPHQPRHQGRDPTSRSGRSSATARWTRSRAAARCRCAANEGLDNLNFVINCNLQRLDGPVRGNGKIIQELESFFRGAGWNVIKVVWGREWDDLLARDHDGALAQPHERHARRRLPDLQGRVRRLRARELLRPRPARARARRGATPTTRSGTSSAAATTTARSTRRSRRPPSTRASPPSSSRRRSRATASARASRAATRPTR